VGVGHSPAPLYGIRKHTARRQARINMPQNAYPPRCLVRFFQNTRNGTENIDELCIHASIFRTISAVLKENGSTTKGSDRILFNVGSKTEPNIVDPEHATRHVDAETFVALQISVI
jgi:hypothetical protein